LPDGITYKKVSYDLSLWDTANQDVIAGHRDEFIAGFERQVKG
jgi:hypothetical protein